MVLLRTSGKTRALGSSRSGKPRYATLRKRGTPLHERATHRWLLAALPRSDERASCARLRGIRAAPNSQPTKITSRERARACDVSHQKPKKNRPYGRFIQEQLPQSVSTHQRLAGIYPGTIDGKLGILDECVVLGYSSGPENSSRPINLIPCNPATCAASASIRSNINHTSASTRSG